MFLIAHGFILWEQFQAVFKASHSRAVFQRIKLPLFNPGQVESHQMWTRNLSPYLCWLSTMSLIQTTFFRWHGQKGIPLRLPLRTQNSEPDKGWSPSKNTALTRIFHCTTKKSPPVYVQLSADLSVLRTPYLLVCFLHESDLQIAKLPNFSNWLPVLL